MWIVYLIQFQKKWNEPNSIIENYVIYFYDPFSNLKNTFYFNMKIKK